MLQHRIEGHSIRGDAYNHDTLPVAIADLQSTRDSLAKKSNTNPDVLKQVDATIGSMQAKLDYLDNHKADVLQQAEQAKVSAQNSPQSIAGAASKAGAIAKAQQPYKEALQDNAAANKAKGDTTELNSVPYDPNYQNPDGTKGANVVMSKADVAAKGLQHYQADPSTLNATVAGFNDVENKLNQLADVVNDPKMGAVQPSIAAAMLAHGKGIDLGASAVGAHVGVDTSRINEWLYNADVKDANQATRDYVTAFVGAHEAITQLPRLQTFSKSSRMTQQQMEAAQNLLPQPGDGPMASQKMASLQGMLDPLRKQVPKCRLLKRFLLGGKSNNNSRSSKALHRLEGLI